MPNADLARSTLARILARPDQHDQGGWLAGVDELAPDTEPDCHTTLCAGGWVAHLSGYTLFKGALAFKDGTWRAVQDVARQALGISHNDASRLFAADRLPEQVIAALDQLADGAPHIDWESAHAACNLADVAASAYAYGQARRRVWPLTHDLYIDGARRSGARGITPTAMRVIVAGWEDDHTPGQDPRAWRDERGIWTTASGHRYVPRLAEAAVIYPGSMNGSDDARRVIGVPDLTWVAPLGSRRLHYVIAPADKVAEFAGSRHVRTLDTPAPDTVYTYLGTTWPPLEGDACQRCRNTGFLTHADTWPGRPAFCATCHHTLRTNTASHDCAPTCPKQPGHTGLCHP
ncbi:hypothetical protein ACH4VR_29640 [Streptomyces sp. NPDC020883]|uniref:hypothetical protein n=1 Tax=Streptomyces sp. NPDC020883 TaxID=3365099 RepID=UPI0037ADE383